jgi:hypothetical protein
LRDDLRTAYAGGASFLLEPSAVLPDAAGRQSFGNGRKNLHDPRGELAVLAIEMTTGALDASCGNPENLDGLHGAGQSQEIIRYRSDFVEVCEARLFQGSTY